MTPHGMAVRRRFWINVIFVRADLISRVGIFHGALLVLTVIGNMSPSDLRALRDGRLVARYGGLVLILLF